jgi:hypothetical protein
MVGGPTTLEEVAEALRTPVTSAVASTGTVPMHQVVDVFDSFLALERCAGGAVLRTAGRYEDAGQWKRNGATSPEDDIARKSSTATQAHNEGR